MQENNRPIGDDVVDDFLVEELKEPDNFPTVIEFIDANFEVVEDFEDELGDTSWVDDSTLMVIDGNGVSPTFNPDLDYYNEEESSLLAMEEKKVILATEASITAPIREIKMKDVMLLNNYLAKTMDSVKIIDEGLLTPRIQELNKELPTVDVSQLMTYLINDTDIDTVLDIMGLTNSANGEYIRETYALYTDILKDNTNKVDQDLEYKRSVSKVYLRKYLQELPELQSTYKDFATKDEVYLLGNFVKSDTFLGFKCSSCDNHISTLSDAIAVVIRLSDKSMCILPNQMCDKCGTKHSYSKANYAGIQNLVLSLCKGSIDKLSGISRQNSISYIPSNAEIVDNISSIIPVANLESDIIVDEFSLDSTIDDFEIEDLSEGLLSHSIEGSIEESVVFTEDDQCFDWEKECEIFLEKINLISSTRTKLVSSNSIHNSAVVLSNQYDDYETVKQNAMASLIKVLENDTNLRAFSLIMTKRRDIFAKLEYDTLVEKDNIQYVNDIIGSDIVKDDGTYDEQALRDAVEYLRDTEDILQKYVDEIYSIDYILSYIPITTMALTANIKNSYFYDQRLIDVLSYTADLMILNHYAENVFEDASPTGTAARRDKNNTDANRYTSKVKENSTFSRLKRKFLGTKPFKFDEAHESYASFFSTTPSEHLLYMFRGNKELYHDLYRFMTASRRLDIYQMSEIAYKLKDNANLMIPVNPVLHKIYSSILECPNVHGGVSKYDFYFKDITVEVNDVYKGKFVDLFESKGYLPAEFRGTTQEEVYINYEINDVKVYSYSYMSPEVKSYFERHSMVLTMGIYLDSTEFNKQYLPYLLTRDSLFTGCKDRDILNRLLNLSDISIVSLLEDDWTPRVAYNPDLNYTLFAIPSLNLIQTDDMDDPESELKTITEKYKFLMSNKTRVEEILYSLRLIE